MKRSDYTWTLPDWPRWRYDPSVLQWPLTEVSRAQGRLLGRLADIGFDTRNQAALAALTDDVVKTSEIEGERLDEQTVRSSIAVHLGVETGALPPADRHVEGVVSMVLDATMNCAAALTRDRLFGWHAALFPTGYSNHVRVAIGRWRNDARGPMQIVSGRIENPTVHYEAPPAERLEQEMSRFLQWVEHDAADHPLLRAGLAHLWFETIHPFDDGNGRVGRAISDMLMARADGSNERFYSMAAQISHDRKGYYEILHRSSVGTLEVTPWLLWFLKSAELAVSAANERLDSILLKTRCWVRWGEIPMNHRQKKVLNRVLSPDGFIGNLTNKKWATLAKCSRDVALRDINELLAAGVLKKSGAGGRSTSYEIA
jgi:Fic family protein